MANIILAHGILGFDEIGVAGFSILNYFKDVEAELTSKGHKVYAPDVSSFGSIVRRAEEFEKKVISFCQENGIAGRSLHIIAHSMGGLDARHALAQSSKLSQLTKSLVTLGTPHKGSPIADFIAKDLIFTRLIYGGLLNVFKGFVGGLRDLTQDEAIKFDLQTISVEKVNYFSIAGTNQTAQGTLFSSAFGLVGLIVGDNDGVVTFESANKVDDGWNALPQWPVDHAGLIGLFGLDPDGKYYDEHIERYIALVEYLSRL